MLCLEQRKYHAPTVTFHIATGTLGLFRFPSPPNFELAMRYVILLIERNPNLFLEIFYLSYSQRAWGSKICARPNRIGKKNVNFSDFLLAHQQRLGALIPKIYTCPVWWIFVVAEACGFPATFLSAT